MPETDAARNTEGFQNIVICGDQRMGPNVEPACRTRCVDGMPLRRSVHAVPVNPPLLTLIVEVSANTPRAETSERSFHRGAPRHLMFLVPRERSPGKGNRFAAAEKARIGRRSFVDVHIIDLPFTREWECDGFLAHNCNLGDFKSGQSRRVFRLGPLLNLSAYAGTHAKRA